MDKSLAIEADGNHDVVDLVYTVASPCQALLFN